MKQGNKKIDQDCRMQITGKQKKIFERVFSQPPLSRGLRDIEKHLLNHDTVPLTLKSKINYNAAFLPVVQVSKMLICNTVLVQGKPLFYLHSPSHDTVRQT